MNAEIEREIVQNFVQKRSKERLRWELSSPKKRLGGMSKINKREYLDNYISVKYDHSFDWLFCIWRIIYERLFSQRYCAV